VSGWEIRISRSVASISERTRPTNKSFWSSPKGSEVALLTLREKWESGWQEKTGISEHLRKWYARKIPPPPVTNRLQVICGPA
jgi:hypothetical protein